MAIPAARANPYVGPRAFLRGETLYGRDREVMELLDLMIAERIVLLYSPSGAGKTSLVQASLIPKLEAEGFRVLPPMRLRLDPPETERAANRYALSALLSLEEGLPGEVQAPLEELAGLTLAEYLDRRTAVFGDRGASRDGLGEGVVLVFDQFEEVLTADPTDREAKAEFFSQVGEALRDWGRWALFAMREEYLAGLDPYLRPVPTRLATTYRLELLGRETAREAMQEPARGAGVEFTDGAASRLVDDLRRVRVQRPDGTAEEQLGLYVEPVQLQVVCWRLWEGLPPDDVEIDEADVVAVGDVDRALRGYYSERVAAAAAETGVQERAIRRWFDGRLITDLGIRGQVLQGPERSEGLANRAIWPLVDAHLVRAEQRRGATWFELAHDRLIEPVRVDNAAWRERHLSALQRQAALWQEEGRPDGLLFQDVALAEAEAWAAAHDEELTEIEREFLAECREARAIAERERRQALRIRRLAVGATVMCILAMLLAFFAWHQWRAADAERLRADQERGRAEEQAQIALYRQLAAQAVNNLVDLDRSLLLSLEAAHMADAPEVRGGLLAALASSPRLAGYLQGHLGPVYGVAFSPDGRALASGSGDSSILLWDVETRQPLGPPLFLAARGVGSVAFSPDGQLLALGEGSGRVILLDVATGEPIAEFDVGRGMWVESVAFSPDGRLLAADSDGFKIRVWDIATGEPAVLPLEGHESYVKGIAFSPDGRILASGSADDTIILWDVATGAPLGPPLTGQEWVNTVAFAPDGAFASGAGDGTIFLWDLAAEEPAGRLLGEHPAPVVSLAFSPDGRVLASGSNDNTILLWDVASGESLGPPLSGHGGWVRDVAFSPDGLTLVSGGEDGAVILWDLSDQPGLGRLFAWYPDSVRSVAFSPDGQILAAGGDEETIVLWDVATGEPRGEPLSRHSDWVRSVAFSPDGRILASAGDDSAVILWDVATGEPVGQPLRRHTDWVRSVAFSPDGRMLASGGDDQKVILWDVASRKVLGEPLEGHTDWVRSVAFSPDGRILASGGDDRAVILWDVATGRPLYPPLYEHKYGVYSVAFSPDGQMLASGGADYRIVLWDVAAGKPMGEPLVGHVHRVGSVAFSPDGRMLASGSQDGTVILWDVATGQLLGRPLTGHDSQVYTVAFSPGGRTLASGADDGVILFWDLDFESLQERACRIASRNLTYAEWAQYLGNEPYRATCPSIPLSPPEVARQGMAYALAGDLEGTRTAFEQATRLAIESGNASLNNNVCWYGGLYGFAEVVLPACDRAVDLAGETKRPFYQDSRGVSRALTGAFDGAAEDFRAFVEWAEAYGIYQTVVPKRQAWIAELEAGRNPFDKETLQALRNE